MVFYLSIKVKYKNIPASRSKSAEANRKVGHLQYTELKMCLSLGRLDTSKQTEALTFRQHSYIC